MVSGVKDAMILANQLFFGIFADRTELLVDVCNSALHVSDGDDRVLI
jgi:hypothetical protein